MKKLLVLLILLIPAVALAAGSIVLWNTAEEAIPDNNESLSLANDRMHDIKVNTRTRGEVEHWWGDISNPPGADDNGMHRNGSAKCFTQDAAPTALSDSVGTLDSSGQNRFANTELDDAASNSGGAAADDIGHGRCWMDTDGADGVPGNDDDNLFQIYVGEVGDTNGDWADIKVAAAVLADTATVANSLVGGGGTAATDDEILAGSANLIYNGSFEATGGTGEEAATTVPSGWAEPAGTASFSYHAAADTLWGDGLYVQVTSTIADESIQQTLTNIAKNTVFKVVARGRTSGGGDCDVYTTGAATDLATQTTSSSSWETLSGTFETTSSLDTVVLNLKGNNEICYWDHVGVYRVGDVATDRDEVDVPTMMVMTETTTSVADLAGTNPGAVPSMSIDVTPPSPNCLVQVNALVSYKVRNGATAQGVGVQCQIDEEGTTKTIVQDGGQMNGGPTEWNENSVFTMAVPYTSVNPTPGTTLTYQLECADGLFGSGSSTDIEYNCDTATCSITAVMFCGGH